MIDGHVFDFLHYAYERHARQTDRQTDRQTFVDFQNVGGYMSIIIRGGSMKITNWIDSYSFS